MLNNIGPSYAQNYITRFGFEAKKHPAYLTMALGAGSATPWQMASAYAVFANGGYRVKPNLIAKIVDKNGTVISTTAFDHASNGAPRVIDQRNAFIMNSMMQSVIRNGTAAKALKLGRSDIAGKTGTTNDHMDAWFAGYSPKQVAVAWIGFDTPRTLGKGETGAAAALPIWIKYMATALKDTPEMAMRMPEGVDAITMSSGNVEYFYHENVPNGGGNSDDQELPPLLDPNDTTETNAMPFNDAQQLLQPNAQLPAKPVQQEPQLQPQAVPSAPKESSDAQSNAARLLNAN